MKKTTPQAAKPPPRRAIEPNWAIRASGSSCCSKRERCTTSVPVEVIERELNNSAWDLRRALNPWVSRVTSIIYQQVKAPITEPIMSRYAVDKKP
jgi:hypothetical protein